MCHTPHGTSRRSEKGTLPARGAGEGAAGPQHRHSQALRGVPTSDGPGASESTSQVASVAPMGRSRSGEAVGTSKYPGARPARPLGASRSRAARPLLTGRLPVGFLAVRAVVYVDVRGLLLFHSHAAAMEETQMWPPGSSCPPLRRGPRWREPRGSGLCARPVAHRERTGEERGDEGGARMSLLHMSRTRRGTGLSSRPACISPERPGGLRSGLLPPPHQGQSGALGRAPPDPMGAAVPGEAPQCWTTGYQKNEAESLPHTI